MVVVRCGIQRSKITKVWRWYVFSDVYYSAPDSDYFDIGGRDKSIFLMQGECVFMKRKPRIYALLMLVILLCGCGMQSSSVANNTMQDESTEMQIENDIVFICSRQSYGYGFVNKGYFIDKNGCKGYFDLSNEGIEYANINVLYSYLEEHYADFEKSSFIDGKKVMECYDYLKCIDMNASIEEECVMTDYGSYIFYGIRLSEAGNTELIMLEEYGDWNRVNSDKWAKKIMEFFGKDAWR